VFGVSIEDLIPKYYTELSQQIMQKIKVLVDQLGVKHFTYSKVKRKDFWDSLLDRISCLQEIHDPNNPPQEKDRSSNISFK